METEQGSDALLIALFFVQNEKFFLSQYCTCLIISKNIGHLITSTFRLFETKAALSKTG